MYKASSTKDLHSRFSGILHLESLCLRVCRACSFGVPWMWRGGLATYSPSTLGWLQLGGQAVALKVSVKGCYSLLSVGCSKENVHQVQRLLEFPTGHCSSASQPQAPWLKCCPIITLWIEMSESQLWFEICSERNPYYLNLQNTLEFRILVWSPVAFGPLITAGKQQRGKVLTLPVCVKTLRKI